MGDREPPEEWDDNSHVSPIPVVTRLRDKWEGEDEDDDVKDNWDDEDEPEKPEPVVQPKQPSAKTSGKKALARKIAEKEARSAGQPMSAEDQVLEKLARRKLQEESDLKVALESFGVDDYSLECKEDMDKFRNHLVEKMKSIERNPLYVGFLETTFRDLCASLEADDIKRIASSLTTLSNEKIKASKTTKKKKKPAATLKMERSNLEVYEDNEYDDFM